VRVSVEGVKVKVGEMAVSVAAGVNVTVISEVTVTCGWVEVEPSEEGRQAVRIKAKNRRLDFFMKVSLFMQTSEVFPIRGRC
jgi:hypothetical protein